MTYDAKILADSLSPAGVRLTTMQITFPRFVLAEFNTHRTFCLAGDAELEFDLPAGTATSDRRVYRMRIDEFVDKWTGGARRIGANPKRDSDLSWIEDGRSYSSHEIAARLGLATAANIHSMCRSGAIPAKRGPDGRTWMVYGTDVRRWRSSAPEHTRFDMRAKLAGMKIRQLNEATGDIQWSHVLDAVVSGSKMVYEVRAGDFCVAGSADHLVMTSRGWVTIGNLSPDDSLIVRKFGKRDDDRVDPMRLLKIDGVWRSQWQHKISAEMRADDPLCRRCRTTNAREIHHIVPVHEDPSRALDRANVTFLCEPCHRQMHEAQGWQGGTYLYGAMVTVDEIVERGVEQTYDLSIAGDFPNFLANGVVVHNSRNSASSRAIPVEKRCETVRASPFVPVAFARNKRGMQAGDDLAEQEAEYAMGLWTEASKSAEHVARLLAGAGVHKQWANRLIEPFCWHAVIVTATDWANFFALRCSPMAQPEIREIAERMKIAMDASAPEELDKGDWHLPLVAGVDAVELQCMYTTEEVARISAARCARVSYLTHEGKRDVAADIALAERLAGDGHMSPFEHAARPGTWQDATVALDRMGVFMSEGKIDVAKFPFGNLRGWCSLRWTMPGEAVFGGGEP